MRNAASALVETSQCLNFKLVCMCLVCTGSFVLHDQNSTLIGIRNVAWLKLSQSEPSKGQLGCDGLSGQRMQLGDKVLSVIAVQDLLECLIAHFGTRNIGCAIDSIPRTIVLVILVKPLSCRTAGAQFSETCAYQHKGQ